MDENQKISFLGKHFGGTMKALIVGIVFLYSISVFGEPNYCHFDSAKQADFKNQIELEQQQQWQQLISTEKLFRDPATQYAHRLFTRLTGLPASESDPIFFQVKRLIKRKRFFEAALLITDDPNFLQIRMLNFAAPFTTGSPRVPFDDLQALIIGITRDELDARLILTGDIRYQGYSNLGLPRPSLQNNDHYRAFAENQHSFLNDLQRVDDQWEDLEVASGAFTTHAWADAHYFEDTNRRAVAHSFEAFLCSPIEQWKTRGAPDGFVRRDVDRAPGGVPATYQNHCRSCHGMMDGMGGAFARMDYLDDQFKYLKDSVASKMNQNPMVYPLGFAVTDDYWVNQLDYNKALDFGWRSEKKGFGVQAYGKMLANSKAFSQCMVRKTFKEVCGPHALDKGAEHLEALTNYFETNDYNLKQLFAQVASHSACLSHP